MKKSFLALLVSASLLSTALVGCADKETTPEPNKEQSDTTAPQLNEGTNENDTPNQNDTQTGDTTEQQPYEQETDPSQEEIKEAFGLTNYRMMSPIQIGAIGVGQIDLGLEEQQRIALAKAMTTAMSHSGWSKGDKPPAIFLSSDNIKFAVGMKKQDDSMTLERYELQENGEYKSVKKETK
ncbi:MAG TPA: hypothetical protein VFV52_14180 [Bacilli bacterium]|nr:hypothetical protein [Bacilli bacterium]